MRISILFLASLHLVYCECPPGYNLVQDQCSEKFNSVNVTWSEAINVAIAECQGNFGQPVIIHNDEENSYWAGVAGANFFVTGLVCNTTSYLWQWADGSALDFKPKVYHPDLDVKCKTGCTWDIHADGSWNHGCGDEHVVFDIFCAAKLRQPIPSDDECGIFENDSDDGVCYQVGETAETWQDAQMNCKMLGANLASIHNLQENSFIRRLSVSNGAVNGVFLGASVSGKGNAFGWVDGSDWDYENFYPGFPMAGVGDCLAMDTTNSAGQWMNINCASKLPVACAREQKQPTEQTCNPGPSEEGNIIVSPGFPYNASVPCDFFLTVEDGKTIEVEIILLEANPCCDFLVIHDQFLGGNMIANLTGEVNHATYKSASNLMRVSWQPNGGVNVKGLAMSYRSA